jgi:hypothetical protein
LSTLQILYSIALHIAVIVALFYYSKLKNNYFKYFGIYLLVIMVLDVYCFRFYRLITDDRELWPVYSKFYANHLQIPLQYFFFSWFYHKRLESFKTTIKIGALIYLIAWIIESLNRFGTGYITFFTYSYQIGTLWMLILALLYFIDLMKSDRIIDFHKERFFYVSLGMIIFYVFSMPLHVFKPIFEVSENEFIKDLYRNYSYPLNICMYLLFAASFRWGTRN